MRDLLAAFTSLKIWKNGEEHAPHKPLLVLWVIGQCLHGKDRMTLYKEIDRELGNLLRRFGTPGKTKYTNTNDPFYRLKNDGFWELCNVGHTPAKKPGGVPSKSYLIAEKASGGFPREIFDAFQTNCQKAVLIAYVLLVEHFPFARHDEILDAVGIQSNFKHVHRRPLDPLFNAKVLDAYDHRCAVCAFALCMSNKSLGLEAAHIKWPKACGPDQVANALSLCALHHRLFDKGAFTLSFDWKIMVSMSAGGPSLVDSLGRYESREVLLPKREDDFPEKQFLAWHHREVFGTFSKKAQRQRFT